ncbi:MAG: acyl-CoA thioester hydrolase/BAAT C-terminal domain-containing protein [Limisphaerales bacterium]
MKIRTLAIGVIAFGLAIQSNIDLQAQTTKAQIDGQSFVADFYATKGAKKTVVLFLSGSEGGRPHSSLPQMFAQNGYSVLAIAYFKEIGLPETLQMVPLEYFDGPLEWIRQNHKESRIVLVGASKGAELALLLASRKPDINGVIALSPSSVVWDGLPKSFWPPDPKSSWSAGGEPVPFVPYNYSKAFAPGDPRAIYKFYEQSLTQKEAVKKATIPVEKIAGPVLLASGAEDQLWPAREMGEAICDRLKQKGFKYRFEHVVYQEAGHTFNEYFPMGGTKEGNRKARLDLADQMLRFLQRVDSTALHSDR